MIYNRIVYYAEKKGVKLPALAKKCGIPLSELRCFVSREKEPSVSQAIKIAEVLKSKVERVFVLKAPPEKMSEKYRRAADQGLTAKQAAQKLSVPVQKVYYYAKKYNIQFSPEVERNEELIVAIKKAAKEGLNKSQAARNLNVSPQRVSELSRRHAIDFNNSQKRGKRKGNSGSFGFALPISEYIAAAEAGLTFKQAAEKLGVTEMTVRRIAAQNDIEFKRARKKLKVPLDEYVAAAEAGLTFAQAAEVIGVSVPMVRYIAKTRGIDFFSKNR